MITAADNRLPDVDGNEDVLVILGLARPSWGRYYEYRRRRCQIMVVGLWVAKCTSAQRRSRFQRQLSQADTDKPEGLNANRITGGNSCDARVYSSQYLVIGRKRKLENE